MKVIHQRRTICFLVTLTLGLCLPALTGAQVCNVKVVTDASPDSSDMDSMIHSITSRWDTPYDATSPIEEEEYRLTIKGVEGVESKVTFYCPHDNKTIAPTVLRREGDFVEVRLAVTDQPRLLIIEEQ